MTQDRSVADELAAVFARMSGLLLSEETLQTVLQLVVSLAEQTIPGTVGAGVTLVRAGGTTTAASSDPVVGQADALQYELGEGPCLTAYRDRRTVQVDDVAHDQR